MGTCYIAQETQLAALWGPRGMGERDVQEGGDISMHIADSLHCTAETNTTL